MPYVDLLFLSKWYCPQGDAPIGADLREREDKRRKREPRWLPSDTVKKT
jgi:hypothetical protein